MRIPVTMCHGIDASNPDPWLALSRERFEAFVGVAVEMGFVSVNYDDLASWRADEADLPSHPIMFDFDHPMKSMRYEVNDVLAAHGYRGNLFVNTGMLDSVHSGLYPPDSALQIMTWDELGELRDMGWHIGAHTVTHPSLSSLGVEDPSGVRIRAELEGCDERLKTCIGVTARDFAFTGTSWSRVAEAEVARRYRFGRLWIIGWQYDADGRTIRFAELVGVDAPDEEDGGPPMACRYITESTHPYRLPSMELQNGLITDAASFRRYLAGAL